MSQDRIVGQCSGGGLRACWASDVGRVRDNNEDSCIGIVEQGLFIVADGMGGEAAGERASQLATEWLPGMVGERVGRLQEPSQRDIELALRDAVFDLNCRIRDESSQMDGLRKMGTTVVMALVRGPHVHIAYMGDSRAYLARDGQLEPLTRDHSVLAILVERGIIPPELAPGHPMRGRLQRYVGMEGDAEADVQTLECMAADRLLLCTDGLTDPLEDGEIGRMLTGGADIRATCDALIEAAKACGSRDNITVLIAEWEKG